MATTSNSAAPNTQRAPRLDSVTGLRFFAAAFVVIHHTAGPDDVPVVDLGFLGVTFFFVLSGFVLTWAGSADRGTLASYRNRFARIYPLHLVTLLIAVITPLALEPDSSATFLQNLTLTHAWTYNGSHSFNWVSWSISCEAFFYLLFPIAVLTLRRVSSAGVAAIGIAAWVVQGTAGWWLLNRSGIADAYFFTYDFPPFRFAEFLIGVCLAVLMKRNWRPLRSAQWATMLVAALGILAILKWDFGDGAPRPMMSSAVVPAVIVMLWTVVRAEQNGRAGLLGHPWLRVLGEWSFALYMVHILVLRWLAAAAGGDSAVDVGGFPAWSIIPVLVLCVLLAGLAHRLVERPAEKLLRSPSTGDRLAAESTSAS